ncbi:MAG: DNA primase [Pirellulales bacterium]|nr:DNA primase [Pirellulales bacterium]
MSNIFLSDAKEQVRQATDIVELVGSYISLRRQGRIYVGLCPWHDDSRPSLQVNPQRQSFKCWVCDIGGDVFSFLMKMEGIEFREALESLAERAGIPIHPIQRPADGTENSAGAGMNKKKLLAVMAWAEGQYHDYLLNAPESAAAQDYLADRQINQESILRFRLGFAPPNWDWLIHRAAATQFPINVLQAAGLVIERAGGEGYYDRFRGRIIFPIRDTQSRPIALGGRILPHLARENDAKYINSPESPLFSKSTQLYGLDLAKETMIRPGQSNRPGEPDRVAIVMEGYTDCIMAHQHGISNAVAVLGTALTDRHIPLLRRYADTVLLVLDGDEAGQKRANEVLDLFVSQQVDLQILTLPRNLDPCDFIVSHGGAAFREMCNEAVDALEHKIRTVTKGMVAAKNIHRANVAVEEILDTLARVPQPTHGTSSAAILREQQVLSRLAREFQVPETTLRSRLAALRHKWIRGQRPALSSDSITEQASRVKQALDPWDQELFELLFGAPDIGDEILRLVRVDDLRSEPGRALYVLCQTIRNTQGTLDLDRAMVTTEDPAIKSLLVAIDEDRCAKESSNLDQRLTDLLSGMAQRRCDATARQQLAALQHGQLDEQSEDNLLQQLFQTLTQRNQKKVDDPDARSF